MLLIAVKPRVRVPRSPHRDISHPRIDSDGVHDQRISLPMGNGIAVESDIRIFGMRTPIRRYHSNGLREFTQNPQPSRLLDQFHRAVLGGLRGYRRWRATRWATSIGCRLL